MSTTASEISAAGAKIMVIDDSQTIRKTAEKIGRAHV